MFDFEDIVSSANIYLAAKDKRLRYLYCNENVAKGLGLDSPSQIVGKTDYDIFTDPVAQMYRSGDIATLKGNPFINVREYQPQADKTIQILTTKNILTNKKGEHIGVIISYIDISNLAVNHCNDILKFDNHKKQYIFKIGNMTEFITRREYDVFKEILKGYTANQIALNLAISPRTVECHIEKIKRKLQCQTKHHIIEAAIRLGIIQQNIVTDLL